MGKIWIIICTVKKVRVWGLSCRMTAGAGRSRLCQARLPDFLKAITDLRPFVTLEIDARMTAVGGERPFAARWTKVGSADFSDLRPNGGNKGKRP